VEQHDAEMDANALLKAIEFTCNCKVALCIKPRSDFIKTCRQRKFENQRGKWLAQMVRQAVVVDQSGQRYFDNETSTIHIGNGHVACWRRFNSIFDVKPRMQTVIRSWALASDEQHSIWNSDVVPERAPRPSATDFARSWIRNWALEVGCFMPNSTQSIHVDAIRTRALWQQYILQWPEKSLHYPAFCKAYNTEAVQPPLICKRKKKDVSSPCRDCLTLKDMMAKAVADKNKAHMEHVKRLYDNHFEKVRAEKRYQMDNVVRSRGSDAPHLSLVLDIMDQKKTMLPNVKDSLILRIQCKQRMPMKLVGLTDHGSGKWFAFAAPPWVPKGGNLTCSCLYLALLELKKRRGSLPRELKVCALSHASLHHTHT
jgi:hypothetical protein